MNDQTKHLDLEVKVRGIVIEHLTLGKRQWFTIKLPNNQIITIDRSLCEELKNGSQDTVAKPDV